MSIIFYNQFQFQTYNVDRQVPDSAGTATAIFTGVKAQYKMLGLDGKVKYNTCDKNILENSHLTSIASWAQDSGMDTGKSSCQCYILSFGNQRNDLSCES